MFSADNLCKQFKIQIRHSEGFPEGNFGVNIEQMTKNTHGNEKNPFLGM